jgi:threonine aldolase
VERLADDHDLAKEIAAGLSELDGIAVDIARVETNIALIRVEVPGITAADLVREVEELGVRTLAVSPGEIRLVTHLDVPRDAVREVPRRFEAALRGLHDPKGDRT